MDGQGDSYTHQNLFAGEEIDRHLCHKRQYSTWRQFVKDRRLKYDMQILTVYRFIVLM